MISPGSLQGLCEIAVGDLVREWKGILLASRESQCKVYQRGEVKYLNKRVTHAVMLLCLLTRFTSGLRFLRRKCTKKGNEFTPLEKLVSRAEV